MHTALQVATDLAEALPSDTASLALFAGFMLLCLLLSFILSGSEVALFSVAGQIGKMGNGATTADRKITRMLENPRRLLATIQIGNLFVNLFFSVLGALLVVKGVAFIGMSATAGHLFGLVTITLLLLVLGEFTPRLISFEDPLAVSRRYASFLWFLYVVMKPLATLYTESSLLLEKWLPRSGGMTTEDLDRMAGGDEMGGSIQEEEREIIENVIDFGNIEVREIMTSRVNIVAVSTENTLEEVVELIREKGFSRMPLYETDLDNILGVIYAKDVLPYINRPDLAGISINWTTIARKVLFIPSTKKLDDLLRDFQREKSHLAIVVDEYGGTEGLVTLDDILEEIVGDMGDEHDEGEEKLYTRIRDDIYLFDAKMTLNDMEEIIEREITSDDDEFETLGGLVYHLSERIPNVGERFIYRDLELTVHSVRNNRVRRLRVRLLPPGESPRPEKKSVRKGSGRER